MTINEFDDVIERLRVATRYVASGIPDDLPLSDARPLVSPRRLRPTQGRRVWAFGAVGVVAAATVGVVVAFDNAPPNAQAQLAAAISRATAANTARISITYTAEGVTAPPDEGVVNFAENAAEASTSEGLTNIRIGNQEWYTTLPVGSTQPWTHEVVPPAMSLCAAGSAGNAESTGNTGQGNTGQGNTGQSSTGRVTGSTGDTGASAATGTAGTAGGASCSIFNFGINTSATVLVDAAQADQSDVTETQSGQYAVNLQNGATATFTITNEVLTSVTVVLARFGTSGAVKGSVTYRYSDYGVAADIVPPTADTPPLRQSYANGVTAPQSGTGDSGSTGSTGAASGSGNSGITN